MLADKLILSLDNIELENKALLPELSGIYYVVDIDLAVWYIGRSVNLRKRWNGEKPHHRYEQLIAISIQENKTFFIYYLLVRVKELYQLEKEQIRKYQPRLNNTPVIKSIDLERNLILDSHPVLESKDNLAKNQFSNTPLSNYRLNIISTEEDRTMNTSNFVDENNKVNLNSDIKEFKRKFIMLRDDDLRLNLQLEICIDSKDRLFVRHYTLYIIFNLAIKELSDNTLDEVNNILSTIDSKRQILYISSIKWLGYKLKCENVLIIDEEEDLKIETLAIMIPFNLFVDLVEYQLLTEPNIAENLANQEKNWYKNRSKSTKIAKWLHDNNLNLRKLIEEIK